MTGPRKSITWYLNEIKDFILAKPVDGFQNLQELQESELRYVDDLNIAMLAKTPRNTRRLLYSIACFILVAIVWAYFAKLDEVTVGTGKVIPSQQIQVVQNLEGGIVKKILVREGELIKKGQELLTIDETRFLSDVREQESLMLSLLAQIIRLKTELDSVEISKDNEGNPLVAIDKQALNFSSLKIEGNEEVIQQQQDYYNERLLNLGNQLEIIDQKVSQKKSEFEEITSKISHFEESYNLVLKELNITKPLAEKGVVSEVELIKLQRNANEVKGELASAKILRPKLNAEIIELSNKREEVALQFRNESQQQLAESVAKVSSMNELLVSLKDKLTRTIVKSPVDGTIKTIKINTVGGVIQPGMDLIEIVPNQDSILIEAKIRPKDIAFLRPELQAVIKLTAYDFAIYGGLKGIVEHISADTIVDEKDNSYYLIRVRTDESYFDKENKALPIIPGMTASVDVMTGKKSVLNYILKPIIRAKQSALREK